MGESHSFGLARILGPQIHSPFAAFRLWRSQSVIALAKGHA
ncbi:unnamed protein product [Acidithrix sp. C25]|nr:unnamed protein product [Acidithrix sp. C25]CAG4909267.1 unnamed protein product [Acidithrix sp. C25]CAG4909679.1 unnamed protein product [Acidithrix sp. C25]CAG4929336.1 unnamed protein product [Acidithrix sp. C25]